MTESDCNEALQRLYGFLDGELDDTLRAEIKSHLDDCSPCLGAFDFEAELRVLIATRCREQVPEALRSRVAELLSAPPPVEPAD